MSVRIHLNKDEVKEKLEQLRENDNLFSIDVDIDDIDHDDLEGEGWYENRFCDHLDDDGYEAAKEEVENSMNNDLLMLRDMFVVGKTDEDVIEKLKEILRNKGLN